MFTSEILLLSPTGNHPAYSRVQNDPGLAQRPILFDTEQIATSGHAAALAVKIPIKSSGAHDTYAHDQAFRPDTS
jgi:hypothetical protein